MKLLERAQAASEEDFERKRVRERGVHMLHKYMDPVEVGGLSSVSCLLRRRVCFRVKFKWI